LSAGIANFDRFLFAFTIGSHILLVSLSIGLSILISALEFLAARSPDKYYSSLARRLVRPLVISFGVGTGSGIVMAVELVNLFPKFMTLVSNTGVIAIFYVEIFAFFLETIFLVIYVYRGNAFRGRFTRWALTLPIMVGTLLSAVLIVMVNAWMNTPNGFDKATYISTGAVTNVNPWAPFLTTSTGYEVMHVVTTVPLTGLMLIGGYFAYRYLHASGVEERTLFLRGLRVAAFASLAFVVLAIISGALEIDGLYKYQPLKYAAIELDPNPGNNLPLTLFGSLSGQSIVAGFQIPGLQSILTGHANLPGLSQYPSSLWPPLIVHTTFDVMVIGGGLLGLFVLVYVGLWSIGRRPYDRPWMTYLYAVFSFLTLIVMELGWATDEIGRQPWIVYNVLTVNAAANYSDALLVPGLIIVAFYLLLVPFTIYFMVRVFNGRSMEIEPAGAPEGTDVNY